MNTADLYFGEVVHERKRPRKHRLKYRVFSILVDIDQLDKISSQSKLFSYNKWNLFSICDRDFGTKNLKKGEMGQWVRNLLKKAGQEEDPHQIKLLCYPRILGYVFNPLSVYFCYAESGNLLSIVYEVHNTFGERHTYVIEVKGSFDSIIRQTEEKKFYVSPFIEMNCQYKFRVQPPSELVRIVMRVEDSEGLLMAASYKARKRPFNDLSLAKAFIYFPLMTIKVIIGIHWEALRLYLKNIPYIKHTSTSKVKLSDKSK